MYILIEEKKRKTTFKYPFTKPISMPKNNKEEEFVTNDPDFGRKQLCEGCISEEFGEDCHYYWHLKKICSMYQQK